VSKSDRWTFWDYYNGNSNSIDEWYQSLSEYGRDLLDNILKKNRDIEVPRNWLGFKRFLSGKYRKEKIWELAFFDGVQYRILGIFDQKVRKKAILLIGCHHKQRIYTPPNALDVSQARARAIYEGRAKIYERKIREDI
jgi:hypothetical protein